MYTSRSQVESYLNCPMYRYNKYHYGGKGFVSTQRSIPLTTGRCVHRGVEHILNRWRIKEEPSVDVACELAVQEYEREVENRGFASKTIKNEKQQWFTYCEQRALTEALVRAWAHVELPNLQKRFNVISVEREIQPIPLAENVLFMAKVDAEFSELETNSFYAYSLKTIKRYTERTDGQYRGDLQGITETWAIEEDSKRNMRLVNEIKERLESLQSGRVFPQKQIEQIKMWLAKQPYVERMISGVRFCFLIKGDRKKSDYNANDPDALHITYNPLIRGYKNIGPAGTSYAHSWYYPNPDNKSGRGILGRGWEPFNVWESGISLRDWIQALFNGEVQPNVENPVIAHVLVPIEYNRNPVEIEQGMREVTYQEKKIANALHYIDDTRYEDRIRTEILEGTFPHDRSQCHWMKGEVCEYMELCWNPEVRQDPVGSELYEIRVPHHETER